MRGGWSLWAWAALSAGLAPGAALADVVNLHGDAVDLSLATGAQAASGGVPTVQGQADLTGRLTAALQAALHLQIQASDGQDQGWGAAPFLVVNPVAATDSGKLGLDGAWAPSPKAKVEVSATDQFHRAFQWASPYLVAGQTQDDASRQQSARAALTLQPFGPVSVQFGGETASDQEQSSILSPGAPVALTWSQTGTQRAFTAVKWKLLPQLSLEGGGALETVEVGWRSADAGAATYAYVDPRAAATLSAWAGGKLQVSFQRVVSPVNAAQFGAFIDSADHPADTAFQPDHEWRYTGSLEQKLAGADLSASYIHALLESVTDLGPAGTGQAPMSIGGGERSELDLALTAPLDALGLSAATLTGKAALRDSRVVDPFTDTPRRLSGEEPYQAELNLARSVASQHLNFGVKGQLSGPQTVYQMDQVSALSPAAGLGGFIDYTPGSFVVRLQLDDLVGGGRTDREIYFVGARALDLVGRTIDTRQDSRAISLSLKKAF